MTLSKIKILSKLYIFGMILVLFSCEKDLYDLEHTSSEYKFKNVSIKTLENDSKFNKLFQQTYGKEFNRKLKKHYTSNLDFTGKFEEGFVIADTISKVVYNDVTTSYNFLIEYPSKPASDTIYNLIIMYTETEDNFYVTKNLTISNTIKPIAISSDKATDPSSVTLGDCLSLLQNCDCYGQTLIVDETLDLVYELDMDCIQELISISEDGYIPPLDIVSSSSIYNYSTGGSGSSNTSNTNNNIIIAPYEGSGGGGGNFEIIENTLQDPL